MRFTKIRLTKDASNRLRFLAGRTGLTPNLLCRMGFCLSLEEPKVPNPSEFAEEEREFNRYTLLGEYDSVYIALLRQRLYHDNIDMEELEDHFRAHLNRGIALLQQRVRSVADLANLVPSLRGTSGRSTSKT
jgi:DNA sulfur modification protein DndE